jgi:hypothetical protein
MRSRMDARRRPSPLCTGEPDLAPFWPAARPAPHAVDPHVDDSTAESMLVGGAPTLGARARNPRGRQGPLVR